MNKLTLINFKKIIHYFVIVIPLLPLPVSASFIESTIGTAVVNDATAVYYNPAALTLLKNTQLIGMGTASYFQNQFTGQAVQSATGFTQSGTSNKNTHYYLPAFYMGFPTRTNITTGVAVIANDFNSNIGEQSILRYFQSSNQIQDIDLVPAIAIKLNKLISIGANFTLSHAHFLMQPISGLPTLNIPDSQSRNDVNGTSWGGDMGILLNASKSTVMGFNYRSSMTYHLSGTSTLNNMTSSNYHYQYWTPARSVFSINQFITPTVGLIGTVQYIQWNIFKNINVYNIAKQTGVQTIILPNATVPYHFHNSWLFTAGCHYRISPIWIIRVAGSYIQTPTNGNYQVENGNTIVLGASVGYHLSKNIVIDGSYAHAFIQSENTLITTGPYMISGVNKGAGNAVSLKLTVNV